MCSSADCQDLFNIKGEDFFKDVTIYLSWVNRRNNCRVDIKLRQMTRISDLAKQLWLIDKADWLTEYCNGLPFFKGYTKFVEFKYLQHIVGIEKAEEHLDHFLLTF